MDSSNLTPGTHKRKNQKQVLAMMRVACGQAGCDWSEEVVSTGKGVATAAKDGATVLRIEFQFGTNGAEFRFLPEGGEPLEAPALYTDTSYAMDTLRRALGEE